MSEPEQRSRGGRLGAAVRARKWLVGLVLAAIAAAVTGLITNGINSGVHHVRGTFEKTAAPVGVTLDQMIDIRRPSNFGSAHYVFTRPIKAIPFPTRGDLRYIAAWDAWARQYGGLDADRTFVRIIVEGNSELPVVLTGLTVDVTRRARPPKGVHVVPFGGGPLGVRYFDVDLDARPAKVTSVPAEFTNQAAIDFPYRVSQTEPEVLNIAAYTTDCDCSWRAVLHWIYQHKSGVTVIDDHGRPFRTVSGSRSTQYLVSHGRFVKDSTGSPD
jgi:hypothetical protein